MPNGQLFSGILAPVLTPFNEDLSADVDRFVAHCQWLLQHGCHGLAVFGTTGEANSQSVEERMALLDALLTGGIDPQRLLVGTGCCALTDSVRLTRHAVDRGCGGVLLLPPFYYKDVGDDGLFRSVAEVVERVGDERLRVYLYHIPPVAVVGFRLPLIERLATAYPGAVVGVKDSSGDWPNTAAILKALPHLQVFPGSEVFLLASLRAGAAGCISGSVNVNPAAMRNLYDRWRQPEADAMQEAIIALRQCILKFALIPAFKRIVAHYRDDPAWCAVRPPLAGLGDAEATRLLADVRRCGYAWPS